jgi:peptide/nickel transport system substrate-binding protein
MPVEGTMMLPCHGGLHRLRRVALLGVVTAVALASLALSATTPAGAASSEKPVAGGTATMLISAEPTTFDTMTIQGAGGTTGLAGSAVYDNLFTIDPNSGRIVPRLAESVTPNADATQWTIKLRPKLVFSDGTTLDANAIKTNWDRLAGPTSTCGCKTALTGWTWVAADPLTFKVAMPTPVGGFPAILALAQGTSQLGLVASPTALQKFGSSYGTTAESTVGAGPWTLKEWIRGSAITLVKNPRYWDAPRPYLDSLVLKPVVDQAQKANAMQANQADIAYLPVLDQSTKTLSDLKYPAFGVYQDGGITVEYNVSSGPLSDVRIRKALTMAANLPDMNQKAAVGTATTVTTYFAKGSPFYNAAVKQTPYSLKKAQQLIDQYVAEKGPVNVTLLYGTGALVPWANALLQSWAQLKNITITGDQQAAVASALALQQGRFQAGLGATPNPASYPETFYQYFSSGSSANVQKVNDPRFDKVLSDSRGDVTVAGRKKALDQITKIIEDNQYFTRLYYNINTTYTQKYVKGVVMKDFSQIQPVGMWLAKH